MTLATSKKTAPLPSPTIKKERAEQLTKEILNLGEQIGSHLCEMRDSAGYRHLGYKDFITYCKTEFGTSKSRAYQLIDEAQIEQEIRQESKILENRKLPGSQLRILKDLAPEDRVKVIEFADKLVKQEQRTATTADDLKAAAIQVSGGIPNREGKWIKPLAKLGFEKDVEVIANQNRPTEATGVIKKVHRDGRVDVHLYGFNRTITYSFGELELTEPRKHIPLSYEKCSLNQEVQVFSSRLKLSGVRGIILGRLNNDIAIVQIDRRQHELRYEELAAVEEEEEEEKVSSAIVDVNYSATLEDEDGDKFNWTEWARQHFSRLLAWLAKHATDEQRLYIFSALAENLSAEGRVTAIGIFGGTADGNEFAAYKYLAGQKIETLERELASQNKQVSVRLAENNQLADRLKEKQEEYYELEKELKSLRKELEGVQAQTTRIEQLMIADTEDSGQELSSSTTEIEIGDRSSISEKVLTPFREVKIKGLLAQKPLMTQEVVEALGDSYSEVMETLTRLGEEGIVLRQGNRWQLVEAEQREPKSDPSDSTTTNDTNTFEVGDRVQIIQPEGWCEIAYANIGQVGIIQGQHKKGGYNVLLDQPPAQGKRKDVTLTANRIKLVEQLPSIDEIETTPELTQQIADTRIKLTQEKEKLEQELKSATTNPERNKLKKKLTRNTQNLTDLETFSQLKIGQTVSRPNSAEKGTVQQIYFSPGGMPQVWVAWENDITKSEPVANIKIIEPSHQESATETDLTSSFPTEIDRTDLPLEEFKQQLIPYVAQHCGAKNPYAYANKILQDIQQGKPCLLYDDFLAGKPLGSQIDCRPWEVAPGINIPALEEERIQYYIHKGEPIEQATLKAREELRNPTTAQALWDGFLRKCDRLTDDAINAKKLGVETPYLPPSFTDRTEVTKESVGAKLEALHAPDTADQIIEASEIPTLESLRESYSKPAAKNLTEKAVRENPQWGYKIEDLEARFPFQVGDYIQDESSHWMPLRQGKVEIVEIDGKQLRVRNWVENSGGKREAFSWIEIGLYPSIKKAISQEVEA